uniref:Uncharacterized protein n=1 Tax=Cacopsylla melanoneura TaxID=428564 RepID=A0A8D8Y8D0_9HEMI
MGTPLLSIHIQLKHVTVSEFAHARCRCSLRAGRALAGVFLTTSLVFFPRRGQHAQLHFLKVATRGATVARIGRISTGLRGCRTRARRFRLVFAHLRVLRVPRCSSLATTGSSAGEFLAILRPVVAMVTVIVVVGYIDSIVLALVHSLRLFLAHKLVVPVSVMILAVTRFGLAHAALSLVRQMA